MTPSFIRPPRFLLGLLFFTSGFCGLLYQIVWMRLAFASFGITTPVMSVVLSVFMAGLALGTWAGGHWTAREKNLSAPGFLRLYAFCEGFIALGALAVPALFSTGETLLLAMGSADSTRYLFFSAAALFLSLLPWCFFMGATFPFMMAFMRKSKLAGDSFSYLYTANVLGAVTGTLGTLLLVETLGFHGTLGVGAGLNIAIALAALALAAGSSSAAAHAGLSIAPSPIPTRGEPLSGYLAVLFATGFTSMAMEVTWTRDFTPVLGNQVYSYASILFTYLLATFLGAWFYRRDLRRGKVLDPALLLGLTFCFALLTIVLNDPRIRSFDGQVLLSIVPFCAVLGYLTPRLVDRFSLGDPLQAARAYAVNVWGCILGPLAASYLFLPLLGVKWSLVLFSLPFLIFFILRCLLFPRKRTLAYWTLAGLGSILSFLSIFKAGDYEELFNAWDPACVIRRDYAATVVSGGQGLGKKLFINGLDVTSLVEPTKIMAHLPLASLSGKPRSALDICFGMGTTFRSLSRWGIEVTAVELVPSVPRAFGYYFPDAGQILSKPNCRVVVDDGNRFLHRTREKYDVITVDPPPPPEAAGSSLLYSTEFYGLAKSHLRDGGILQVWSPRGEYSTLQALARSLTRVFPTVRIFASPDGMGYHFLASTQPLPRLTAEQLLRKMPLPARQDLMEWFPTASPQVLLQSLLAQEIVPSTLLNPDPLLAVTDDHPYNEYYFLRRLKDRWGWL